MAKSNGKAVLMITVKRQERQKFKRVCKEEGISMNSAVRAFIKDAGKGNCIVTQRIAQNEHNRRHKR